MTGELVNMQAGKTNYDAVKCVTISVVQTGVWEEWIFWTH